MKYAISSAEMSDDGKYRYVLRRIWDLGKASCVFVGLNPSTADALVDDPTIRRCVGFATAWGCGRLTMLNLFAYRATNPYAMIHARDPIGLDNDAWLREEVGASIVVAAWGNDGAFLNRSYLVPQTVAAADWMCLGVTKSGQPRHPLYVRADQMLVPFDWTKTRK